MVIDDGVEPDAEFGPQDDFLHDIAPEQIHIVWSINTCASASDEIGHDQYRQTLFVI
jgi:hypothetical protein